MNPLISIVIANYNKEHYVIDCLKSLLTQETDIIFEVILVDDGSSDASLTLINRYLSSNHHQFPIKVFSRKHKGKIDSFNFGVTKSKGQFIKLFGSDDIALPFMIESLASFAKPNQIIVHNCSIGDRSCNIIKKKFLNLHDSIICLKVRDVINGKSFPSGNFLIPKKFINYIFPIDVSASYEDWFMSMCIAINKCSLLVLSNSLFIYRQTNQSAWGGIFNFSPKILKYRALRDLNTLNSFKVFLDKKYSHDLIIKEKELLALTKFSFTTFIFSNARLPFKLKYYLKVILHYFFKIFNFLRTLI